MSIQAHIVTAAVAAGTHSLTFPFVRKAHYGANELTPNLVPELAGLIRAYVSGVMDPGSFARLASYHGAEVNLPLFINGPWRTRTDGILDVDVNQVVAETAWDAIVASEFEIPALGEALSLLNREVVSERIVHAWMQLRGFSNGDLREKMLQLRYEVPGPADLVRFAVRHVFEPDLVATLGYNDEYRPILDAFHHAQGVDYPIFSGPLRQVVSLAEQSEGVPVGSFLASYAAAGLPEPTWARAYWWSHWVLPSPTQGYTFLQRLRSDRDKSEEENWVAAQDFSLEDLRTLLRANDYPPFWRDKLAAVSYLLPGRIDTRRLYESGIWDERKVYDNYLRLGYEPRNARALTDFTVAQAASKKRKDVLSLSRAKLKEAMDYGVMDVVQAQDFLEQTGMPANEAVATTLSIQTELDIERVKLAVQAAEKKRELGIYDDGALRDQLRLIGVNAQRIDAISERMALKLAAGTKVVSAAELRKWACEGLVSLDEMAARLSRLGYTLNEIQIMRADVLLCIGKALDKAALAAARTQRQQQQALEKIARQARSEADRALRLLASHGSPTQIARWAAKGIISEAQALARLRALHWPDADATSLLTDAAEKLKAKEVSAILPSV